MHAGWVSLLKINPDRPCQDCRGSPQEAWLKLLSKGFKALKSFIPSHSIWKVSQICKCNFRNPKWDSFDASDTLVAFQSSSINVDQQKLSENWTEFAWNIWGYSRRNRGERNLFDQTAISHLLKMSLNENISDKRSQSLDIQLFIWPFIHFWYLDNVLLYYIHFQRIHIKSLSSRYNCE